MSDELVVWNCYPEPVEAQFQTICRTSTGSV